MSEQTGVNANTVFGIFAEVYIIARVINVDTDNTDDIFERDQIL